MVAPVAQIAKIISSGLFKLTALSIIKYFISLLASGNTGELTIKDFLLKLYS